MRAWLDLFDDHRGAVVRIEDAERRLVEHQRVNLPADERVQHLNFIGRVLPWERHDLDTVLQELREGAERE